MSTSATTSGLLSEESAQFVGDRFRLLSGPRAHDRLGDTEAAVLRLEIGKERALWPGSAPTGSEFNARPGRIGGVWA